MARLFAVVVYRVAPLAGIVASVGCAQIAGIDQTSGSARAVDSIVVTRQSIGATVVNAPLDITGFDATYFPARPGAAGEFDRVVASHGASPGIWTTQLHEPAAVQFTLPDVPVPIPRLYAFPSHQLQVLHAVLEHPGAAPAPDTATFTVTAPLDTAITAADSFQTYVVGAWLVRGFTAAEAPAGAVQIGPVTYGFVAGNSVAGHASPDRVTAQDAFLILRYAGGGLTGVATTAAPVDQSAATTTVTMQAMAPVVQDQTLNLTLAATLTSRYGRVAPAHPGNTLAISWNLVAAPGYQIASNAGPVLRSGTLTAIDTGLTATYGNPFAARGWHTIFTLATSVSRVYTAPGTMASISLFAAMNQFAEPTTKLTIDLPAGLPYAVALDGTPLTSDTPPLTIKPPSQFVRVTFVTDTPGGPTVPSADLYNLQVWDLSPNPTVPTALDRRLVFQAASNAASFLLPPEVLQPGHSYTLRALATLGGYPALGDGNFVMRNLPLAQSFLDSGVVTVMP
ncbi:MAG TPA: hypothetical protein VGD37_10290 [Kofleriaceae bacterium]|jgi:hypothetical protein